MPSSTDSTNPNSPFGVAHGYPAGTQITDKQRQAQILQDRAGLDFQLATASTTRGSFDPTSLRPLPSSPLEFTDAHHDTVDLMLKGNVAQEFFERRNSDDIKRLEQAHLQTGSPAQALQQVFESRGYTPPETYAATMAGALPQLEQAVGAYTQSQVGLAEAYKHNLPYEGSLPERTKGQLFAGRLMAGQVERNVSQPMAFSEALEIAQQQLGSEAGHIVPIVQGQRLEPESESEKRAFARANKQVKGGEPQVQQSFSDLTTVVKELSNALKDLTKSAKPQESKGDLIQKRHDLAMEQQRDRQEFSSAKAFHDKGQKDLAHDRAVSRQERGGTIRHGHIQAQHQLAMKKQKDAQEHQISLEERREQHREKMAGGRRKSGLTEFALGAMHRGDVLRFANFGGRVARRAIGGGFNMGMGVAGGSSIAQSLSAISPFGLPIGAMTAMPMNMLQNIGMRGAEMELTALQAESLETGRVRSSSLMSSGYTVNGIMALSTELGISPSQSASMLKDVGMADPNNSFSVSDLTSLAVRGFDPSQVAQIGGQLGMLGIGGSRDVIGLMNKSEKRGSQAIDFASRVADFSRSRRVAGLGVDLAGTANRVKSMGVGAEAGLATLGKVQGTALQAGQGLTSMFGGMADLAIRASAFEQAGGDLFRAQGITENMSASPKLLLQALEGMGMSTEQQNLVLAGKGFTTRQVAQLRGADGAGGLDKRITPVDTTESLVVSRKFAQRQQADVKQLYSTTGKDGESMITKLDAMLTADAKYQEKMLKTMVKASQIENIGSAVTNLTTSVAKTNILIAGIADFLKDVQTKGLRQTIRDLI